MAKKEISQEELDNDITDPTKDRMTTKQFWIRFGLWCLFALIIPLCYLAFKYQLIEPKDTQETAQFKFTGWGILAVAVICVFMVVLMREVERGLPKGSMLKQCIKGGMLLIPFILFALLLHVIKNTIAEFENFMVVTIVSEAIAIPINPFPKWGAQSEEDSMFKSFSRALAAFKGTESDKKGKKK